MQPRSDHRLCPHAPAGLAGEWIASRAAAAGPGHEVRGEIGARNAIDRWPETAARALFAVVEADGTGAREVPFDYIGLVSHLPADLKALALARIRACRNERTRLSHLAGLDAELTDAERLDIVEEPLDDPASMSTTPVTACRACDDTWRGCLPR